MRMKRKKSAVTPAKPTLAGRATVPNRDRP
jgi:hypothetical protein